MGNICRSPTAQGVFSALLEREGLVGRVEVDSAGTHAYHVGEPPDERAMRAALGHGIDLSAQRARRVVKKDFESFDYVLAMDRENHSALREICPSGREEHLYLFMDFAPHLNVRDVPDPYYGGPGGFEQVIDLVEAASRGLLAKIKRQL
jgi:protein-tyrosine phosphatase